ncbi:MAG TPA: tyrosine--tRNA ligase [Candidatus Paceibacterota bacterium]|jgi:tyrosyl-tRNA synthetase|nr:tyrosine--tRNA ligase [Candidatus Paceibacterota bacterium]HQO70852.1 tyrosine--tRNA ligase [Candidatus Paceibacterota bacterium]
MENKQEELLKRGISAIYPSVEFLESKLKSGKKLTLYLGIDPTGPTLHLGHFIPIKKMAEFQKAGHQIIILIGDFTAMIGDPTDKKSTRQPLNRKQILNNLKDYKKQISTTLSFKGKNKAKIKFNSKWLGKMKFEDVLSLASNMTVQQMLERDMFKKRMEDGRPVSIHEFLYPLMQAYDSVVMDVDGEIGGNDQTFNMLCGRDLMKTLKNKEKFVITTKLLEDNQGQKMGKTEGNMVALSDSPDEMFGKIMSWSDGLIISSFELCTNVPMSEINQFTKLLEQGEINPRDLKMRLAKEIITIIHNENKAKVAEQNFIKTFQKKEVPDQIKKVKAGVNDLLIDVLLNNKVIQSKTEFRRLINEGAISIIDKEEKITQIDELARPAVYRIGKKRFIQIEN